MVSDLILGIESSCDDTSVGVVARDGRVLSNVISSQAELHSVYGGVYPQLASREHLRAVLPTVELAMKAAEVSHADLKAIAVTRGPGLIGSLIVGVDTARALARGWGLPIIGVNHLRGHVRSADLEETRVEYPAMILLVSGGHTLLAHMTSPRSIELLGSTRDDSVGEAYDKTARLLGKGYPGGPIVDKMAASGSARFDLPRPMVNNGLDFSFSGLKTAVRVLVERSEQLDHDDVAASFVDAVLDVLTSKVSRALELRKSSSLIVVGGVAASPPLRERMAAVCAEHQVRLCLPPVKWATDNGAMIALAAWDYVDNHVGADLSPKANLGLAAW